MFSQQFSKVRLSKIHPSRPYGFAACGTPRFWNRLPAALIRTVVVASFQMELGDNWSIIDPKAPLSPD